MPAHDRKSPSGPEVGNPWIVNTAAELLRIDDLTGVLAYVTDIDKYVTLDRTSTETVDNLTTFQAVTGRWTLSSMPVTDPVQVRQLSDLPTSVAGVITLAANTRYEFLGLVDVGANSIQLAAGDIIEGRDGIIRQGASANYLFVAPPNGTAKFQNVTLQSNALGCITTTGAADIEAVNCSFENAPGYTGGYGVSSITATAGNVELIGCRFGLTLTQGFRAIGTVIGTLSAQSCIFEGTSGMYVDGASTVTDWMVNGCIFKAGDAGFGLHDVGGTITHAQSTGNDFSQCTRNAYNDVAQLTFGPIEVRHRVEFGTYVNPGERNLVNDATYVIIGDVSIPIINLGEGNSIIGRGGTLRRLNGNNLLVGDISTGNILIEGINFIHPNTNPAITIEGGAAFTATIRNCRFTTNGRALTVDSTGTGDLVVQNCYFDCCNALDNVDVFVDDVWDTVVFTGCEFVGPRDHINISVAIDECVVSHCIFDTAAGETGLTDNVALNNAGAIVGNIFKGAGAATAGITALNGWTGRGNVGVADF